ncbi:class C beta-lactamase [Iodobacter fluviatilis]|uniref:Beta-lactamase n=1 Tax=Iodobacter fluviatilis TaxID=537 RepID=A0A377Q7I1_9NEIS|nr:class C beta-lactamase [Iodobacter fluviatilis]TCU82703.1 beta-lactamase class C [Iodobacter fluviatilis]STQ89811.1 Beta-lactamase [Iodobacter fluviatilis]
MCKKKVFLIKIMALLGCISPLSHATENIDQAYIQKIVSTAITPIQKEFNIPGIAVAVSVDGKNYFFNYGVASKESKQAVSQDTLFEIGSISKTFTATLASAAQINGQLSFSDSVSQHLADLRGSAFDKVSLLNLATHTAGGLPLQVPDEIKNNDQLMAYFKNWQPEYAAGTYRVYSNPSIGLLGVITAKSMNTSFEDAIEKKLFPELGMAHSYINVPAAQMKNYAQGYNKKDAPVRVNPGVLSSEAYGVKSSPADMIQFVNANMQMGKIDSKVQQALINTHSAYFKSGALTQDLIWEQYAYPLKLSTLLEGNKDAMAYKANTANKITPPLAPQANVWINKTGSTNGFAAYAAFIPAQKIGIVILANKNYPIPPRVTAAYQILSQLDQQTESKN